MKDRIKNLLINSFAASEIATIVGCSPSYVSQLIKDPEFLKEIEAGKIAVASERTEEEHIDVRYQSLEHKLLTAAEGAMQEASLGEITRAIEVINKRADSKHARKNPANNTPAVQVNVVTLTMPQHALPSIQNNTVELNEKSEIIAIGGRSLSPMSSDAVKNLFAAKTAPVLQPVAIEDL